MRFFYCLASFLISFQAAYALKVEDFKLRSATFGIIFVDGSSFYANSNINDLSMQEYISGPLLVKEIVIGLPDSSCQCRIYYAELIEREKALDEIEKRTPESLKEQAEKASFFTKRTDEYVSDAIKEKELKNMKNRYLVNKEYPVTTHSKTLEFMVTNKEEIQMLYDELLKRFTAKRSPFLAQAIFTLEGKVE